MGLDKLSLSNSAKNVDNQASVIIKMCGTTLFVEGGIYTSFSPGLARWEREYCNLLVRILQSMSEQYSRSKRPVCTVFTHLLPLWRFPVFPFRQPFCSCEKSYYILYYYNI